MHKMKKRVWCNLPDVLLERMLPLLPVSSLLRFRCVCKSWNSYILSADFLKLCAAATNAGDCAEAQESAYILLSTWTKEYPLLALNPSHESWHLPSLDLLKEEMEFSLVAAAGGLLCLSDGESRLTVCNPVTKAKREVVCRLQEEEGGGGGGQLLSNIVLANMRCNESTRSFQLLVVGSADECRQATCLYDSAEQKWRVCRKHRETLFFESNGVFHGDDFFVVNSFPLKLMAFNTTTAIWRDHPISLPEGIRYPCLAQSSGLLLLLAAVEDANVSNGCLDDQTDLTGYRLWKLDEGATTWEELARVPDLIFQQIVVDGHFDGFSCAAQKHLIYLSSSEGCLVHDTVLNTWRWLLHSPILAGHHACIKDVYALEPSLDNVMV